MTRLTILNGSVLSRDDGLQSTAVVLEDGRIARLGAAAGPGRTIDANGLLVLPGIVDIHGDAFERQLQPRPGVGFDPHLALQDTEAQLLANGITTALHGVTLSWEPGLRGMENWGALLDAIEAGDWVCDMRVHLRWEAYNLDALDVAIADIAAGRVHLLAFNDHTPAILRHLADPLKAAKYSDRAGLDPAAFRELALAAEARAPCVAEAQRRIAAAAQSAGLPIASHDDDTVAARAHFRNLGARICEFPVAEDVGEAARQAGDFVVMGSPNVVRGGSHLGWASAAVLAEAGICNVLSSDYFYPAMLRAALKLAGRGVLDLPASWALVSANPARACGLADRGAIAPGLRGDLVLVDPAAGRALATIAGGRIAHLTAEGAQRLS